MGGNNWYYDPYNLRQFGIHDLCTFIDIGANVGDVSMMAKILLPRTRIVAIEPCKESFDVMVKNILCWGRNIVNLYHFALGDGTPLYIVRHRPSGKRRRNGEFKFYTVDEKNIGGFTEEEQYEVESKRFKQIFDDCKIDLNKPYAMKIDCEGGERFILQQQEEALNIFRGATQVSMELHLGMGGSGGEWNDFFCQLKDTHLFFLGYFDSPRKFPDRTRNPDRKWISSEFSDFTFRKGHHHIELRIKE